MDSQDYWSKFKANQQVYDSSTNSADFKKFLSDFSKKD